MWTTARTTKTFAKCGWTQTNVIDYTPTKAGILGIWMKRETEKADGNDHPVSSGQWPPKHIMTRENNVIWWTKEKLRRN